MTLGEVLRMREVQDRLGYPLQVIDSSLKVNTCYRKAYVRMTGVVKIVSGSDLFFGFAQGSFQLLGRVKISLVYSSGHASDKLVRESAT